MPVRAAPGRRSAEVVRGPPPPDRTPIPHPPPPQKSILNIIFLVLMAIAATLLRPNDPNRALVQVRAMHSVWPCLIGRCVFRVRPLTPPPPPPSRPRR